jgi:hypothetical protein
MKTRRGGEPRHVRLYEWLLECPAWRELDVYERQLYVEFKARYTGTNNGNIAFSGEEMAAALNCSNRPADRALKTLIAFGFIKVARKGHFDWKWRDGRRQNRSTTYSLTEYGIDYPERSLMPATKEFMRWRPETFANKQRGDESARLGCAGNSLSGAMAALAHPNGTSRSPENDVVGERYGVTTSPAYSLPPSDGAFRPGTEAGSPEPETVENEHGSRVA